MRAPSDSPLSLLDEDTIAVDALERAPSPIPMGIECWQGGKAGGRGSFQG